PGRLMQGRGPVASPSRRDGSANGNEHQYRDHNLRQGSPAVVAGPAWRIPDPLIPRQYGRASVGEHSGSADQDLALTWCAHTVTGRFADGRMDAFSSVEDVTMI